MKKYAKVLLRDKLSYKKILITDDDKPDIDDFSIQRWQNILNFITKIMHVPAALIMQVNENSMHVFLKSNNPDNPYSEGDRENLGLGLYSETVLGTHNELLVDNALNLISWRDNPHIDLHMIAYYGLPLKWPDGEFFGTLCVLDNKANSFHRDYRDLIHEIKLILERDLQYLIYQKELIYFAEMDVLTGVYNRRKIESLLENEFIRAQRYKSLFTVTVMDINGLKYINDKFGHNTGDDILKTFTKEFRKHIRESDYFGRWGGDEFILICPCTNSHDTEKLLSRIKKPVEAQMRSVVKSSGFCVGFSQIKKTDNSYQKIVNRADDKMYKHKEEFYNK